MDFIDKKKKDLGEITAENVDGFKQLLQGFIKDMGLAKVDKLIEHLIKQ